MLKFTQKYHQFFNNYFQKSLEADKIQLKLASKILNHRLQRVLNE